MDSSNPNDAGNPPNFSTPNDAPTDAGERDPGAEFSAGKRKAGGGADEHIWSGGYSAVDQSGSFMILTLITIGLIVGGVFFWPILIAIPVLWIGQFIRVWWIKMGVAYELTTRRFIHEHGVIKRTTDRIEVIDIDDVTVEQGILDRMFNVGTIRITSSDRTHPELRIPGIKEVKKVALMIDDARQVQRDRRGVYIESV
ncbi:PH domain-containing protein [Bremerella sp. P1]|uniref:PH domain-containing protein n=1 Tax=Bremerella sp. P1 TaxID=3026424 RepID=UPI0023677922|nr:PH domain-containing protein [Bremerella sp. P1]WDI42223.1 PH domain-containing protein [Bremerella sp. P1]